MHKLVIKTKDKEIANILSTSYMCFVALRTWLSIPKLCLGNYDELSIEMKEIDEITERISEISK